MQCKRVKHAGHLREQSEQCMAVPTQQSSAHGRELKRVQRDDIERVFIVATLDVVGCIEQQLLECVPFQYEFAELVAGVQGVRQLLGKYRAVTLELVEGSSCAIARWEPFNGTDTSMAEFDECVGDPGRIA